MIVVKSAKNETSDVAGNENTEYTVLTGIERERERRIEK